MRIARVDPVHPDPESIAFAAGLLKKDKLVAFPTETVYGLGANALDEGAVQSIFSVKSRPGYNPLIVHVADVESARRLTAVWPQSAERLARAFWPGPLTLILPKHPIIPHAVTAGLSSVAVRVPAHPVAQALLRAAALPIAAPSANRSSEVSPTTANHVAQSLGEAVDLILDGGPTPLGIESTVLDLSGAQPVLLRPGLLSTKELEPVLKVPLQTLRELAGAAARPSPGMLNRHYAPRAALKLYRQHETDRALQLASTAKAEKRIVGALLLSSLDAPLTHPIAMPAEPRSYARVLYASLHSLDALACDLILVECPPESPSWDGIRDRLQRAAIPL
jgi:L-threonylcarbamoyladenylate synthase